MLILSKMPHVFLGGPRKAPYNQGISEEIFQDNFPRQIQLLFSLYIHRSLFLFIAHFIIFVSISSTSL